MPDEPTPEDSKPGEKPAEKPSEAVSQASAGEAKPAPSTESLAAPEAKPAAAAEAKPEAAEKPAAEKAPAAAAAAKPAAPADAKPAATAAAKPHAEAKPAEPPKPLEPAFFGQFLKEHGIESKRLPDHAGGVECIEVAGKDIEATVKRLRNSEETRLDYLLTITGTEQADSFESVYHLWSYSSLKELVIKVIIAKASVPEGLLPVVPSIANFWPAANWHERETYDLVGIRYQGHPYLRRLLNPWDWEGHPLRRDYKQPVDALNDKNPHSMR